MISLFSYDNIGSKIKTWTKVQFYIVAVLSVILGFAIVNAFVRAGGWWTLLGVLLGLLAAFLGAFLSFIATWTLYGFGQMIEKLDWTAFYLSENNKSLKNIERTVSPSEDTPKA